MRTQTYFHTTQEWEADRRNDDVALQVNCTGAVSEMLFSNRSVRQDYYYIYVLKGKMIMENCTLYPGDVLIYEPGQTYQYRSEGETTYLWVHFTGKEAACLAEAAILAMNEKCNIGLREDIMDCFKRLFKEFIIHDKPAGQMEICLLKEILLLTGRYARMEQNKSMPLLAIEYIHSHYKEVVDVDQLARLERMSCTTFRIAFKKHTGISPNEYIIAQRISVACRLLAQTELSVKEIAGEVGYADQYYFSRIFKKKVGMTPLKYRKN